MTVLTDPPETAPATSRPTLLTRVLGVLVGLAVVAAVFFGAGWVLALDDESLELAETRDVVLLDARQAAINLNSLDFNAVEAGLDLWEQSSTGAVLEEFRANRAEYVQAVVEARRVTQASVTDAAVAELDVRAGVARVLVGVDVQVRPDGGAEPTLTRQRLQLEMTRTEDGWKVSKLAPVR